ncbi:MAG: M20/M25/M40 family metallo-hydrolase [Chitinophagales bacterium]|nr:M20/M25/M40 family metallo-hydrolase [Chitinophagales bacterium]
MKLLLQFWIATTFIFFSFSNTKAEEIDLQDIVNKVNLDSLIENVNQLTGRSTVYIQGVADTIVSRHYLHIGNEKAFQFLKNRIHDYGYATDSMVFSATGKNLLGIKEGELYPKRVVIIGAHYDDLPNSPKAPGADDNASGVSAVLEAARVLKDISLPYTIVFAFWDEEERGLLGSAAYTSSFGKNNDTLIGYINLDMIAWDENLDNNVELHVRPVANSLDLAGTIQNINEDYQIGLKIQVINPGSGDSDYASFWKNNYPAVGLNEEYMGTDFNPYWHTSSDIIDFFNFQYFHKISQLAIASLAKFASDTSISVGISENKYLSDNIKVYPNPFSDKIVVKIAEQDQSVLSFSLFDLRGKYILGENIQNQQEISLPNYLAKGNYILKIQSKEHIYIQKICKQ